MRKKTFKSSYSELYLITPQIYHKIMDNLDNKSEKDSTLELNKTDESSVTQNQEEEDQELPKEVPSSVNNELSSSHSSKDSTSLNNVLEKISELRKIIENNVPRTDKAVQTMQNSVNDKETETDSIMKTEIGVQSSLPQSSDIATQSNSGELSTQNKLTNNLQNSEQQNSIENKKSRKVYFCEFCEPPKEFTSNWNRKRHIANKHNNDKHKAKKTSPPDVVKSNSVKRKLEKDVENLPSKKFKSHIAGKRKHVVHHGSPRKFTKWS